MRRVSGGWIVGLGTLVIPSCASHHVFHHHGSGGMAGGGASGGAGIGAGTSGHGGAAGHAMAGRSAGNGGASSAETGGANSGGSHQGGGASGSTSLPGGASSAGSPTQSTGGRSGAQGGSSGSRSTGGVENTSGGSPDDAGAGNTGRGDCGPNNCAGCCASDGTCVASPTAQACGSKGGACKACGADELCTGGKCGCPASTQACGNACIDYSTSKDNCGGCGKGCEAYQFCSGGKCLPHYVSTRVQPVTSGGDPGGVAAAAVFIDGTQDDLLLRLSGDLVLSAPGAFQTAELHGAGLARYTPDGTLVWSRSTSELFGSQAQVSLSTAPPALLTNGDFAIGYNKYDPSGGPVAGTFALRTARIGGHTGNLVWEAKFPYSSSSNSNSIYTLVPLDADQKIIAVTTTAISNSLGGYVCETTDLGSSGVVACPVSQNYIAGATTGADRATLWSWGAYDETVAAALNPWSSQTWQLTANQGRFVGGDGYLFGARDDGSTIGPWFTEGDYGVLMTLIVDSAGDLIVAVTSGSLGGYVTFNGGQELLEKSGYVLTKINHVNGHIVWKTPIPYLPDRFVIAPGNRIVTVTQPTTDSPYTLGIYAGEDGSLLSSFSGAGVVPSGVLACGKTEMYLAGQVTSPIDFNPGAATDTLGATPGVFVSRFSFE